MTSIETPRIDLDALEALYREAASMLAAAVSELAETNARLGRLDSERLALWDVLGKVSPADAEQLHAEIGYESAAAVLSEPPRVVTLLVVLPEKDEGWDQDDVGRVTP